MVGDVTATPNLSKEVRCTPAGVGSVFTWILEYHTKEEIKIENRRFWRKGNI